MTPDVLRGIAIGIVFGFLAGFVAGASTVQAKLTAFGRDVVKLIDVTAKRRRRRR